MRGCDDRFLIPNANSRRRFSPGFWRWEASPPTFLSGFGRRPDPLRPQGSMISGSGREGPWLQISRTLVGISVASKQPPTPSRTRRPKDPPPPLRSPGERKGIGGSLDPGSGGRFLVGVRDFGRWGCDDRSLRSLAMRPLAWITCWIFPLTRGMGLWQGVSFQAPQRKYKFHDAAVTDLGAQSSLARC